MLADTLTPVSIFLRIRDVYPNSLLLESSDYHGNENSYSFICMKPLATIRVEDGRVLLHYPGGKEESSDMTELAGRFRDFLNCFSAEEAEEGIPATGFFGYTSYDAVRFFEKIHLKELNDEPYRIPELHYSMYGLAIAINHFKNVMYIYENTVNEEPGEMDRLIRLLLSRNFAKYPFRTVGAEQSSITDDSFRQMVTRGKEHCYRGDVFQVVLSRQFSQPFLGDDFNVYRALRSVNPSPYLFYFDYGSYRIFGSSPESQLKIAGGKAYINPIAGTFRRTGDDEQDKLLAFRLSTDLKENAEHVMLVDLARNDLSRHATGIRVDRFREVQYYSHVIHLMSAVSGDLNEEAGMVEMMAATFPAGTLTGAPKYKAMQLIDNYESQPRGYYGGAIGFLDLHGRFNHAIMIRTFLSKGNVLYYQAGAGIVAISDEDSELQEVNNKLGALKRAIEMAAKI